MGDVVKVTSGADSGQFGTIIRDGRDGMHDGLYKVKLATGKCTAYLEERRVWSIEKKKFTEEQWKSFGINDLRREHAIKSSDGGYFRPDLASGLLYCGSCLRPGNRSSGSSSPTPSSRKLSS